MAAARWQKCVYVHKSQIFADIPHPLCVCAPDFMNISFELEREIVVQWKGLSYLNIFTARHHHSIPSLPLSGLLVHCRIRTTGVCVCHVLAWTWKKNYVRIETMGSKNVCKASIHISHTHTFGRYQLFGGWHFTELKIYAVIFVRERKICKRLPATGWLPSMIQIILCTHKLCQWFSLLVIVLFFHSQRRQSHSLSFSFVRSPFEFRCVFLLTSSLNAYRKLHKPGIYWFSDQVVPFLTLTIVFKLNKNSQQL